jgi:hypothetical protein
MKSNHSTLSAIIQSENLDYFILSEFNFGSSYYYTSLPFDVNWNGNTYSADNGLMGFEPPRYSTTVDREAYKITLDAIDQTLVNEVEAGIVHKPVTVRIGFMVNGVPQLGINDTIHSYSGTVSAPSIEINDDEKKLILECSAPLSDLDATSTLYTTKDGISNIDPTDTSFDQILEGSDEIKLKWGKL